MGCHCGDVAPMLALWAAAQPVPILPPPHPPPGHGLPN